MKKAVKIILVLGAVFGLLLSAGAIALRVLYPPEKIKEIVLAQIQGNLNREIKMEGASLGLFSGLTVKGVELSENPDFKAGTFLSAESFRLRLAWRPLLRKKIEIKELSLNGMKMKITKDRNGRFNLEDFSRPASPSASVKAAPGGMSFPMMLTAEKTSIRDGEVLYEDKASKSQAALKNINLSIEDFDLKAPFRVKADLEMEARQAQKNYKAAVDFNGTLNLAGGDLQSAGMEISRLKAKSMGLEILLKGKVENLEKPDAEIDASLPALSSEDLKKFLALPGPAALPASTAKASFKMTWEALRIRSLEWKASGLEASLKGSLSGLQGKEPSLQLKLETNRFSLSELEKIYPDAKAYGLKGEALLKLGVSGKVSEPNLQGELEAGLKSVAEEKIAALPEGVRLPPMSLKSSFSASADVLEIKSLRWEAGGLKVFLEGKISDPKNPNPFLQIRMATNKFSVSEAARLWDKAKPYGLEGEAELKLNVSGRKDSPSFKGSLALESLSAGVEQQRLSSFKGKVLFTEDSLEAALTGNLNGGELELKKLSVKNLKSPNIQLQGSLSELNLAPLLAFGAGPSQEAEGKRGQEGGAEIAPIRTSGSFQIGKIIHPNFTGGKSSLSWDLRELTPDLKSVEGTAGFSVEKGKISDLQSLAEQKKMLKSMLYPLQLLQKIQKKGGLKLGLPDLNNIEFEKIEGRQTFAEGVAQIEKFDLEGPALSVSTLGTIDFPKDQVDLKVKVRMPAGSVKLLVKGPAADPRVTPDLSEIVEKQKEKIRETVKEALENPDELKEKLKKQGEKIFKDLFKGR